MPTSYEPDWRAVGNLIARDCETHRESIEQMADVMSVVRYGQRFAEKGDEDAKRMLDLLELFRNVRDGKPNYNEELEAAPIGAER